MFSIQNLATDTMVGPVVAIPASSDNTSINYTSTLASLYEFLFFAPPSNSSPSAPKGYGFMMGNDGPHSAPLDGSGPMSLNQMEFITSVPDLDLNQVENIKPSAGSGTLSGGAWAGIVIGILAFLLGAFGILRARARRQAGNVNRSSQQQPEEVAGHVLPDQVGSSGEKLEQTGGAISVEVASPTPSSPPPFGPRPSQTPPMTQHIPLRPDSLGQGQFIQSTQPGLSYQPYTPTPFQPPPKTDNNNCSHQVVDGTSQEQFRQTLQLSTHPKPRIATTTQ